VEVTVRDFDNTVLGSEKPVLLEFWASWCPPCHTIKKMLKIIEAQEKEYLIATVNADRNMAIAQRYNVKGLPCFRVVKQGEVLHREVGAKSLKQIKEIMDQYR
jgi:thioredoxin 1